MIATGTEVCKNPRMLAILASATLSKDVRPADDAAAVEPGAMAWYGHRVTIERRKCVVMMDLATRYGMFFPALTKPDFQRLGERLCQRLPTEMARIHGDAAIAERVRPVVDRIADPIVTIPGRDRSIQSHINDVVYFVRRWVAVHGGLPRDDDEAFLAAMAPNWMIKMGKAHPEGLRSAPTFSEHWLALAGIDPDSVPGPVDPFQSLPAQRRPSTDIGTFQFRIELLEAQPPIWRRFRVPANLPLEDLHDVIQIVMGWTDSHLHEFIVGEQRYGEASDEWPVPDQAPADEQQFRIDQVVSRPGEHLEYLYDFGDDWEHRLTLEAVDPAAAHAEPIECLDGARRCPPEDVGGLHGYIEFLETVRDPTHPDHADMLRWAGGEFDPEDFKVKEINAELARRIEQDAARS